MIRTPRTHLREIYMHMGSCDTIDFAKNVRMSTQENYSFGQTQQIKDQFDLEKKQFQKRMGEIEKYTNNVYRQVISPKANYKFRRGEYDIYSDSGSQCPISSVTLLDSSIMKKKEEHARNLLNMDLKFDFEKIISTYIKKENQYKKQPKLQMSMRDIQMIGESDFYEKCTHLEDYYDIISDLKAETKDVKDKELSDHLVREASMKLRMRQPEKGIFVSMEGEQYNINFSKDLRVYRLMAEKFLMPSPASMEEGKSEDKITKQHIFVFAGKGYKASQFKQHLDQAKRKEKQQKILQKENQLQIELQQIKNKIRVLKEKKKEKNSLEYNMRATQTERLITNQYIKDLISLEDQILVDKIDEILVIKQTQLMEGNNPETVYHQLHPILNQHMFELLMIIASGEPFINWADYMLMSNKDQVEKVVLEKIYNNLMEMDYKVCQSGNSKMKLLKYYSSIRLITQKQAKEFPQRVTVSPPIKPIPKPVAEKPEAGKKSRSITKTDHSKSLNRSISNNEMLGGRQKVKPSLKSTANLSRGFNDTTKENTTNFNRTKNTATMQNMQKRINKLFNIDSVRNKSLSKSPGKSQFLKVPTRVSKSPLKSSMGASMIRRR